MQYFQDVKKYLSEHPEVRVISFDLFDTLIFRKIYEPTDIFALVGKEIHKENESIMPEVYRSIRIRAEQVAREEKSVRTGSAEVYLSEIVEKITEWFDIEADLEQMELDVERKVCFRNSETFELLQWCEKKGYQIVYTSDMYLSKQQLSSLLENLKIPRYPLFVSCEYGVNKYSGELFEVVLKEQGIDGTQMIHIGDNLQVDIKNCREKGICAFYYEINADINSTFATEKYVTGKLLPEIHRLRHMAKSRSFYALGASVFGPLKAYADGMNRNLYDVVGTNEDGGLDIHRNDWLVKLCYVLDCETVTGNGENDAILECREGMMHFLVLYRDAGQPEISQSDLEGMLYRLLVKPNYKEARLLSGLVSDQTLCTKEDVDLYRKAGWVGLRKSKAGTFPQWMEGIRALVEPIYLLDCQDDFRRDTGLPEYELMEILCRKPLEKIYIVSAGAIGKRLGRLMKICGIDVRAYIDNNKELHGELCEGIPVIGLEESNPEYTYVIASGKYASELYKQIITMKGQNAKIIRRPTAGVYFFGAGKIGKCWLEFCREKGFEPDGFLDNSAALWETAVNGLYVYCPKDVVGTDSKIFITCRDQSGVRQQLLEMGVKEEQIPDGYQFMNLLFYETAHKGKRVDLLAGVVKPHDSALTEKKDVLFDLQNGMVLGGVESWSYAMAARFRQAGYHGAYLVFGMIEPTVNNTEFPSERITNEGCVGEMDYLDRWIHTIAKHMPCTVICNFAYYALWAAAILKKHYPDQIRIIAVHHSDEQYYCDMHSLWREYIDECFVVSSWMEKKLLQYGMDHHCIKRLQWEVPCEEHLKRSWYCGTQELQIGYAGRVTLIPKRTNLLLELAEKLKELGCRFCINVAGIGDYLDDMRREVEEKGLQEQIRLLGFIDREKISSFWKQQDIMICCSIWEGHSISQAEAMAAGAVPVITDVSGARDDVTDGYNGYVVPVDQPDRIAERIHELYQDHEKLAQMGQRAHATIFERQKNMDQTEYWDHLIQELWANQ